MDNAQFYRELQKDAEIFAKKAMGILSSMQGKETVAVQKDEIDLSTTADIAAEKCIIDAIQKKYPLHNISSEEIGEIKGTEPYRWVIDPLDQTKEYVRGLSQYNCLIAVEYNGKVIVGVTLQHGLDAFYSGSKNNGSFFNGQPMQVSKQKTLFNSFIGYNLPNRKMEKLDIEHNVQLLHSILYRAYRIRPFWDQSQAMSWVARGVLDGNIAPPHVYKWYDIASSIILVEEAGGKVTDYFGNPATEQTFKNGIVASNGKLHEELLGIVKDIQ